MATFVDATTLRSMTVEELKALAEDVGIKEPGIGWPTCCPPTGNKNDIINALAKSNALTDVPTRQTLEKLTLDALKNEAIKRGIKKDNVSWTTCCGGSTRAHIIAALLSKLEVKRLELSADIAIMFANVIKLCTTRDEALKRTKETMPLNLLHQPKHAKFSSVPGDLLQRAPMDDINDLYTQAQQVKPIFDSKIRTWLLQKDLVPEAEVIYDGRPIRHGESHTFKTHTTAPLKSMERCIEKANAEYNASYARLCDIVRCSIVVDNESMLDELLTDLKKGVDGIKIVKLKNRFAEPLFTGIRDCLLNVEIPFEAKAGETYLHIGEIQLHMASIIDLKHESHVAYEYFRDFFSGSSRACEARVVLFDRLKVGDLASRTGPDLIEEILSGDNIDRLEALNDLTAPDVLKATEVYTRVNSKLLKLRGDVDATGLHVTIMEMESGKSHLAAGEFADALRHFEAANKSIQGLKRGVSTRSKDGSNIDVVQLLIRMNLGRGDASLGLQEWDDAKRFYKNATDAVADRPDMNRERLLIKRGTGKYWRDKQPNPNMDKALACFSEVRDGFPESDVEYFVTLCYLGRLYSMTGATSKAKVTLEEAIGGLERVVGKGHTDTKQCYELLKNVLERDRSSREDLNNLINRYKNLRL